METQTGRYPVDYESVQKGDQWTPEELEDILHCKKEDRQFDFAVLRFTATLRDALENRGMIVAVARVRGAVRVLTDEEASAYCERDITRTLFRRVVRRYTEMAEVDVSALPESRRPVHDRFLLKAGRAIQGAKLGWQGKLQLEPYKSRVPRLAE